MNILTNGSDFHSPIHEVRTDGEEIAGYRIATSSGKATDERLWGVFQNGDRVSIRAEGRKEAPAIAVLDAFFRPVGVETVAGHTWVTIPSSGVYYLVLPGALLESALRITRRRSASTQPALLPRLVAWVKSRLGRRPVTRPAQSPVESAILSEIAA